ncbi:hypothetical protein [Halobacillus litoralis]|uniref:Scramblase n=1 Tax=Halobacillus litoralis TaxID=45668 RepID=A0A410MBN7_9BACI|nr:hypothetical protein [Halobacillus litoralis]QAS52100.1 hypothetical protein HLI_07615 [Halobacillus litoralis]
MLADYQTLQIQQQSIMKSQSKQYTIKADDKIVAAFEESTRSYNDWINRIMKFTTLYTFASLDMELLSADQGVLVRLVKPKGAYKDVQLLRPDGTLSSNLQFTLKMTSQLITATKSNGEILLKATGKNMASDFIVEDKNNRQATIKKRSIAKPTTKEAFLSDDLYHLRGSKWEEDQLYAILGMIVMMDVYLHSQ